MKDLVFTTDEVINIMAALALYAENIELDFTPELKATVIKATSVIDIEPNGHGGRGFRVNRSFRFLDDR